MAGDRRVSRFSVPLRIQDSIALAAGSTAAVILAEPTTASLWAGSAIAALGAAFWLAAAAVDGDRSRAQPDWGGVYARVRHPRVLGAFLLTLGAALCCASDGKYGRFMFRAVVPVVLLYFFVEAIPRRDAEQREVLGADARGQHYLSCVRPIVPALFHNPWRGAKARTSLGALLLPSSWGWLVYVAALVAAGCWRATHTDWLRW